MKTMWYKIIKWAAAWALGMAIDKIDTPEERREFAQKIADDYDIPLLDEEQEFKLVSFVLELAHMAYSVLTAEAATAETKNEICDTPFAKAPAEQKKNISKGSDR